MRSVISGSECRPMRNMGVLLTLVLLVAMSLAGFAQTTQLRLVSTAWPPFTNPPGQPRFALDLVEGALGRIGRSGQTSIVEPARFNAALLGGSSTAAPPPGRTRSASGPLFPHPISRIGWSRGAERRRRLRDLARRPQRQAYRHRRGLCLWRCAQSLGGYAGPIAERGRQPHAAAREQDGLHADGRTGRPIHPEQLSERGENAAALGTKPLVRDRCTSP